MAAPMSTISDLWWIKPAEEAQFRFLYLGHHSAITDDDDPRQQQWFHSVSQNGELSPEKKLYEVDFLGEWGRRCNNGNVYRSMKVFGSNKGENVRLGPFLVDIDNSEWDNEQGQYREDLDDALEVTRRAVGILTGQWGISSQDLRVFFTGRKGFNLEVRPSAMGISGSYMKQMQFSHAKFWALIQSLTGSQSTSKVGSLGTSIDAIYGSFRVGSQLKHPFIRLHQSLNIWQTKSGQKRRRKIPLTLKELYTSNIHSIVGISETT